MSGIHPTAKAGGLSAAGDVKSFLMFIRPEQNLPKIVLSFQDIVHCLFIKN